MKNLNHRVHETVIHAKSETQNPKQFRAAAALCGKKGYTIIEMIVSLLIFGILSALLFSTFMQMQRNINKNRWKNQLTEEGVNICDIIQIELMGARKIYYANEDSISFLNQEGTISSFCWKDSLLFKTNKSIVSTNTKIISFGFEYYLESEFTGESSKPIYFLPVDQLSLERIRVIDWKIKLQKGKNTVSLNTGVFTRNIQQQ
jgi:prepilin-type N-terminal cleavage/methylation domain-containing protein